MQSTSQRIIKAFCKIYLTTCLLFSNSLYALPSAIPGDTPNNVSTSNRATPSGVIASAERSNPINFNNSSQLFSNSTLTLGADGDSLTGYNFNAHYTQKLSDYLAASGLFEYGSYMYRANGTVGFMFPLVGLLKFTAEHLSQVLPFNFASGGIDERVFQNAYGGRYQYNFKSDIFEDINIGGYYAEAPSRFLDPMLFIDNGTNSINYRYIAGATSKGLDVGIDVKPTKYTELTGHVFSDSVHYNTIYTEDSQYNADGIGGSFGFNQLLGKHLFLSGEASIRKLYDTYRLDLSWLPPSLAKYGFEFAVMSSRVFSHNQFPDCTNISLRVTYVPHLTSYKDVQYQLQNPETINDVGLWTQKPAVKMDQVLAISDQQTKILSPGIESVSPAAGSPAGGTKLTILGQNFLGTSSVAFDGVSALSYSVDSSNSITCTTPSHAAGTVGVVITTPGGTANSSFTYEAALTKAPIVNSISPANGLVAGGIDVVINGSNFVEGLKVKFGTDSAVVKKVTDNSITVTVPKVSGKSGAVDIIVTNPDGKEAKLANGFTYENINLGSPAITKVSPNKGGLEGKNAVIITGTNFVNVATVKFGTIDAVSYTVDSPNQITAIAPAEAAGTVDVFVVTSSVDPNLKSSSDSKQMSTSIASDADRYNYVGIDSFDITSVNPITGITGTVITNFMIHLTPISRPPAESVTLHNSSLGDISATNVVSSGIFNDLVACDINLSGANPGVYDVIVVDDSISHDRHILLAGFTVLSPAPTLTAVNPSSGLPAGGQAITLTGTNFTGATAVQFGSTTIPSSSFVVVDAQHITLTSPAGSAGPVNITVTTPGGTSGALQYLYEDAPTLTAVNPSSGLPAGGQAITLTGTNFTGATAVQFGSTTIPSSSFVVVDAQHITLTSPAGSAGPVNITVTTPSGTSGALQYLYADAPTVTLVNPTDGPIDGGTPVTITGTNLTGATLVKFGITSVASFTVVDAQHITTTSPAGTAGTVDVTVETPSGTSAVVAADKFTYMVVVPTVTGVSPDKGPIAGGTLVTVTGTDFTGATAVNFGSIAAASYTVNGPTQITATSPAGSAGTVDITVTTPNGTSAVVAADKFTYTNISQPSVTSVSPDNGTSGTGAPIIMNLTGSGFERGATVTLQYLGQVDIVTTVTAVTSSQLTCTFDLPYGTKMGSWNVLVQNPDEGAFLLPNGFTVDSSVLVPLAKGSSSPQVLAAAAMDRSAMSGVSSQSDAVEMVFLKVKEKMWDYS